MTAGAKNALTGGTGNTVTATTGNNDITSTAGNNNLSATSGANNISGATNINTTGYYLTKMGNSTSNQWFRLNGVVDAVASDPIGSSRWDLAVDGDIYASGMTSSASATITSLTPGQVVFPGTGGALTGDANLFWDNTNKRLGVGTNAPDAAVDVEGNIHASGTISSGASIVIDGASALRSITSDATMNITTTAGDITINPFGKVGIGNGE